MKKARLFGHPMHPILLIIPLGFLLSATALDMLYVGTKTEAFAILSFCAITAGVIGGLVIVVSGLLEFLTISNHGPVKAIGAWQLLGNLIVVLLFALSMLSRTSGDLGRPQFLAVFLSIAGLMMGAFTTWLSGEMVDRLSEIRNREPDLDAYAPYGSRQEPMPGARDISQVPVTGRGRRADDKTNRAGK